MNILKKISLVLVVLSASSLHSVNASSVSTGQLADNYVGADGRRISTTDYSPNDTTAHYDTHWMQIERVINGDDAMLNVTINSNFVSWNNDSGYSFGDLFMMDADNGNYTVADQCSATDTRVGCNEYTEQTYDTSRTIYSQQSTNNWQYAYDLGGARRSTYASNNTQSGDLRVIDQSHYEYSMSSTDRNRDWQAIMVNDRAVTTHGSGGTWNTNSASNLLMMSFDISGTVLASADQIALRWAMTCANDIIEVVANLKDNTPRPVPEPSTIMLMFAAMAGLLLRKKKIS